MIAHTTGFISRELPLRRGMEVSHFICSCNCIQRGPGLSRGNKKRLAWPPKEPAFDSGAVGTSGLEHTNGRSLIKCEPPLILGGISYYQMWMNKACSRGGPSWPCPAAAAAWPLGSSRSCWSRHCGISAWMDLGKLVARISRELTGN